ncbi:MAG: HlyD family secretion protein [Geminicoccaceae bacterium]
MLLAAGAAVYLYQSYMLRPWTRDGQVRALIVQITPQVAGNIVKVHVADNQFVQEGDPLLEIDPSQYRLAVQSAKIELQQQRQDVATLEAAIHSAAAGVASAQATLEEARKESDRARAAGQAVSAEYVDEKATAVNVAAAQVTEAQAKRAEAERTLGAPGEENVRIQAAKAALGRAKLDLAWTTITAPSDGFVTNVTVEEGAYARVGTPLLAFVAGTSFWISGYFMETQLRHIQIGDPAIVTLMAHPDQPLQGEVESFGRAISPPNVALVEGVAGLIPQIEPTFDWVRLAQRVPVRVKITHVPDGVELIAGITATVAIRPR